MDAFTYNDIFQTKGIEYIIIIGFLLMLIPFWMLINKKAAVIEKVRALGALTLDILKIPRGVLFGRNHTWAYMDKSGLAEVGVNDMLLHLTGEVSFSMKKNPGEQIRKGEPLTVIDRDGKRLNVISPISGKVVEVNPAIEEHKLDAGGDIYSNGWIYRIEPTAWETETASFMRGESVKNWFRNELDRLKDFIARESARHSPETAGMVLQEGGELRDNTLADLPEDVWQDFQREFLDP
jgi:glycine cleavage system H protein